MIARVGQRQNDVSRQIWGRNVFCCSARCRYDTVTVQFPPPQDDSLLCSDVEVATLRKGNLGGNCILSSSKNF